MSERMEWNWCAARGPAAITHQRELTHSLSLLSSWPRPPLNRRWGCWAPFTNSIDPLSLLPKEPLKSIDLFIPLFCLQLHWFHLVFWFALSFRRSQWRCCALNPPKRKTKNQIKQITLPPREQQFISFIGLFPWAPQAQQSLFQSLFPFSKRRVNERRD